jgi:hypothetical protein
MSREAKASCVLSHFPVMNGVPKEGSPSHDTWSKTTQAVEGLPSSGENVTGW